ncbi:1-phosphatidylinositol 4,5-bisphosphate phosphodiesterase eta-2-like isoform X2 [Stegodyphus dumicola]|uniref:1-phosphatidylinositol 4,5-bisphosphate phosphodiesterase eta-2-like isoform X2 n=1 Tax=Stegodyphus dumicola TaxID=202533 RepID=UPI0015AE3EBA|nr:1-phosphatidylinositol 4,5-bisphosphate phosphodiesterase eta-2-like isoform X2 [Stegodyphus dumicola]
MEMCEHEICLEGADNNSALPLKFIMKGMSMGTVMYKVRSPDRWYRRKYKVDIQNMRLTYSPSTKPFWKGKITTVDLFDLEEVRKGWNTDVFNKLEAKFRRKLQKTLHPQLLSMLKEENCFSLIIGPAHSVVDLIAPNVNTRDAWVRGLNQLIACCKHLQAEHDEERWLKDQVRKADVSGNGSLTFEECLGLLNQLNISMRRKEAKKLFHTANFRKNKIDGEDALDPEEFVIFYRSLTHRPELEELMKKYSVSRSVLWGAEELRNFLYEEQNVSLSIQECESLIDEYEPETNKISGYLSLEGFQKLMTVDQDIFNKRHRIIYQDMTQPLTRYYIASSHNTYLTQGQLYGESSIEGYIQALMRGCRCLEIDTWNGSDGEPVIYHGYTLTNQILFRDVLEAVKQYAFRASQYPVILSIENHCDIPQQVKMAYYITTILGEYLYKEPIGQDEKEHPSPESLARKILIKGKKLKDELVTSEEDDFLLEEEEEREEALAYALAASSTPVADDADVIPPPMLSAEGRSKRIAVELSRLVNYFTAKRFSSFEECRNLWKFNEMASFQESVALNLSSTNGPDFVGYNKKHFSRIYPKGTRADSSNYDPFPYWNLGCQMVALNYQTWDKHMYMNEAKFAQNGRCGYVLKPKYLISNEISYDPNKTPYPGQEFHVTLKVISAQFLPKSSGASESDVVDPYVSIRVFGHHLDKLKKKTKFISNNGFNPVWNETFKFVLNAPEQAIFHFRVKDENMTTNELIGQFAVPCMSMNEGYRHIHLEDSKGQKLDKATLFVHIQKSQYVQYNRK